MPRTSQLVRPSVLARFWGLHPKTLYLWVRQGKLTAVRTPGGQFRVDAAAVQALAEAHDLPVPPFVGSTKPQVLVAGDGAPWVDTLRRRLTAAGVEARRCDDPYEGLATAARTPPDVLLLLPSEGFDSLRAVRALRRVEGTKRTRAVVYANGESLTKAKRHGVDALASGSAPDVLAVLLGQLKTAERRPRTGAAAG